MKTPTIIIILKVNWNSIVLINYITISFVFLIFLLVYFDKIGIFIIDIMQDSILYLILVLMVIIIYLLITQRRNKSEPKDNSQEINNLRDSINSSFNTMSASFNSLSKDVTRDMTQTLTSVNQKVEA